MTPLIFTSLIAKNSLFGIVHLALVGSELPRLVNFVLFFVVLFYFLRRPISQFLKERVEGIRSELERARVEREAARAKLKAAEAKLAQLDNAVKQIKANADAEAAAEYQRVIRSAEEEAEKIRLLAARQVETARQAAQLELKTFTAERAIELATQMVQAQLGEEDHRRLVDQFVGDLAEVSR
jgi:F-type H+-transporting ATPase subunit b